MSSRATIKDGERAVPFVWGTPGGPPPRPADIAPLVARTIEPAKITPDPAEHQARLAAMERDAFAKGYAQGERAGAEAGAKRSEAMLRRLGETLEEMASLRQQILLQSERQLV